MLNAFRHHWNLHCERICGAVALITVLNAFRHHWNLHARRAFSPTSTRNSAQRLSASLESSQGYAHALPSSLTRCSTPFGIIGIFTDNLGSAPALGAWVLNAFRHHWNLHPLRGKRGIHNHKCSTPFGIIGIFTRRRKSLMSGRGSAQRLSASLESSRGRDEDALPSLSVLNAFRHHWNLHLLMPAWRARRWRCSTPFGIIGIFTHGGPARSNQHLPGAQRLSASLESSRGGKIWRVRAEPRAQRLSASLESSPAQAAG